MRLSGYYRIKIRAKKSVNPNREHLDTWFIGYYDQSSKSWCIHGNVARFSDSDMAEIIERIINPEEGEA